MNDAHDEGGRVRRAWPYHPRGEAGAGDRARRRPGPDHHHDDLRHRRAHPQGRVPGRTRPDHRPRAGRRDRGAGAGRDRLRARTARHRRAPSRPVASATPASTATRPSAAAARRKAIEAMGGWRFGNTIDGCQAEYVLVPDAMANLAPVPDGLTDEQVLMCPDIMSTGFGGAESGRDPDRRHGRRVRPGPDRAVRHGRRQAQGRHHDHRRRPRAGAAGDGAPARRRS